MKGTILLVEDEFDTREILGRALERAGYGALLAGSAEEALERIATCGFIDVVVTDVVMGGDDRRGLRLIAELRAAGVHAPVVVITAFADLEKVKFALNEGAAHLLEKPFRAPALLAVIEQVREQGASVTHAMDRALGRVPLTDKERTVARHLLNGLSSTEIAAIENNSPKTIRQHVSQIYAKCGVGSRADFFRWVYVR
jgi:DNA-binding NarL/FixJ family response regulator